jgi:hypothetical protein
VDAATVAATFSGFSAGTYCDYCGLFNTTFVLSRTPSAPCLWRATGLWTCSDALYWGNTYQITAVASLGYGGAQWDVLFQFWAFHDARLWASYVMFQLVSGYARMNCTSRYYLSNVGWYREAVDCTGLGSVSCIIN